MTTIYSKAKIAGHPIHPMLIAFPVTFYTTTFIAFVAYTVSNHLAWWQIGLRANVAGLVTAAVAAVFGLVDWRAIPRRTQAKATGLKHALLNGGVAVLFLINVLVHRDTWGALGTDSNPLLRMPDPTLALVLSGLGVVGLIAAGFLGWALVQTHHVGVDLNDEQRRLERG